MNIDLVNLKTSEYILDFLGYKYHYYLNVDWSEVGGIYSRIKIYSKTNIEHLVNTGDPDVDAETNQDKHYPNDVYSIRVHDKWFSTDLPKFIDFKNDWNLLMSVIEYIEDMQLDIYGFENVAIDIYMNFCDITINTSYDPPICINSSKNDLTKKQNTYNSIIKFIEYVEEKEED